jgi:hypothetical protein
MPHARSLKLAFDEAGPLPMFAVTEWLLADAPASVDIDEDSCGNIAGDGESVHDRYHGGTPNEVIHRHIESSYGKNLTNLQWARRLVAEISIKSDDTICWISRSKINSAYICVRKRKDIANE